MEVRMGETAFYEANVETIMQAVKTLPVSCYGEVLDFVGYLKQKQKALSNVHQGKRDIEIINSNAERFNKEAEENLLFQAPL
jgi:hypothetical protein